MKINEAISQAMAVNERVFKNVNETQAAKIVKFTLAEIAREIEDTDEGTVTVPGFATFTIKQVEREKNGSKSMHKRVTVRVKAPRTASSDEEE